ncbi:MAG TPA: glycoside hydrolase family 88 protein [Verrucomicrobiae bacterium]|nr:glycoside hydrolase family 88 protein [Verrucomicrobiae bacterium]
MKSPTDFARPLLYFSFYILASIFFISCATTATPEKFSGASPLAWSQRLADSELGRRGNSLEWKPDGKAKWDYTTGLFTFALLKLNGQVNDPDYLKFAGNTIGSFITPDGEINGYKPQDESLDNIAPGRTVLALWQITHDERYREAAARLRQQLNTQPRTDDGGFWHKQRYPHQMWLDGLYMAEPFYAEYAKLFNEPADFYDVAKQIRLVDEHTYSPKTGLFYHGWDESESQPWANKITGTSSNFWGRAIGWYAMAMVDVLDYFPTNHPARPQIIATFQKLCAGVVKYQDPQTGLWWQVVDQGNRKGNYLEATASGMFVYALAKGINHGYLPRSYIQAVLKGYRGITGHLIRDNGDGKWSLTHCCSVAGLGYGRDGSFTYYVNEPVVENDLKGIGPFILAGLEVQQLTNPPPGTAP